MSNIEPDVISDVKDHLSDELDKYDEALVGNTNGSELSWLLMSEPNSNGTLTFSRIDALGYLEAHPQATGAIIKKMIEEYGEDWEDVYANGEDYDEYLSDNAEKVHVSLFIDVAEAIMAECPTASAHWNEPVSASGADVARALKDEISRVDASGIFV